MSDETRGEAIRRRRLRQGIGSLHEFAEKSGISRPTLTRAEADDPSVKDWSYDRIEAFLDGFAEEVGDDERDDSHLVRFQIRGLHGFEVVVEGPVANLAELEKAVERLVRNVSDPMTD